MKDEYITAFLELAKAMNDKDLLAKLKEYRDVKEASEAAFKANEKRVVELQFDRNQLENEKVALLKDRDDLYAAKRELDSMSKKTQEAYQEANALKVALTLEKESIDAQWASIAKAERMFDTRKEKLAQAEAKVLDTQRELDEKLAKLKAVVG